MDRSTFFAQTKRRYKTITVAGVGEFRIQNLKVSEMRHIRSLMLTADGEPDRERMAQLQEIVIAAALVDDNNALLMNETEVLAGALGELDGALLSYLYEPVKEWTGFGTDPDWNAIEAAAKNLDTTS